jgi:hypothetical protein
MVNVCGTANAAAGKKNTAKAIADFEATARAARVRETRLTGRQGKQRNCLIISSSSKNKSETLSIAVNMNRIDRTFFPGT